MSNTTRQITPTQRALLDQVRSESARTSKPVPEFHFNGKMRRSLDALIARGDIIAVGYVGRHRLFISRMSEGAQS